MTYGESVRLDFAGALEMLDLVQVVGEHMARTSGLNGEALHWVSIAVRESVINAIEHGNCNDAEKRVYLEFTTLSDDAPGLQIKVRDEGCGFDPASLLDPLAPDNLLKANGRGIFLIRSFMDELMFERTPEGATQVVMVKWVAGDSGDFPRASR
jgi:serine/threonine-protein kinase RsbW